MLVLVFLRLFLRVPVRFHVSFPLGLRRERRFHRLWYPRGAASKQTLKSPNGHGKRDEGAE